MIVNAAEKLKQGDAVSGLTGLKDCASGRYLNVRLDGKGVAPPGWQSVCEPPQFNRNQEYFKVHRSNGADYFGSIEAACSSRGHPLYRPEAPGNTNTFRCGNGKTWSGTQVFRVSANEAIPMLQKWPYATCSEILYHRQTGIFKPACAKHDPHLPEHLKRDRECLSLCDQDGNRVFIRHTTKGLEIWQDKYRQGVLVDPATLKVKAVGREKPTVSELALRLHNAALQAVNQIRVGQEINLSANQAVNLRAGSGIRIASQTEKDAVLLGERIGRTALKVVGICEEKEIAFEVRPSLKDEFVEHLWRAMEKYGIRQENDVAAFLGNVDHESSGGKQLSEATKYSFRGWQNLAPNVPNIRRWLARHGRNAEAEFAKLSAEDKFNIMYAGKNGNTQANDGWTFRGRGGIQLTGRAIYQAFADYSKRQDIMSNPDIVANDPQLAAESSAWFWKIYKPQASERAIRGDFPGARKAVNGSLKGWDDVNAKTSGYLNRKGALMPK